MNQNQLIRLVSDDELDIMIVGFIDDCHLQNLSVQTIRFYEANLRRFHWWCEQTGVPLDPTRQTTGHLRSFLRYVQTSPNRWGNPGHSMADRPVSERTVQAYHNTLRRFFNWLVEQEYIEASPIGAKLKSPRIHQQQPNPFSDDDLSRLTAALRGLGDGFLPDRNRAIVATLLDVGLRSAELSGIQTDHINLGNGRLFVAEAKGGVTREVYIGASARHVLRKYWLRHRQHREPGAFFLNGDAMETLQRDGIHEITTKLGQRAGVKPCNPHRFRHTAAVNALRAGMSPLALQRMLGHSALDMTRRYVKLAESDMAAASRDHSPLDFLKLGI